MVVVVGGVVVGTVVVDGADVSDPPVVEVTVVVVVVGVVVVTGGRVTGREASPEPPRQDTSTRHAATPQTRRGITASVSTSSRLPETRYTVLWVVFAPPGRESDPQNGVSFGALGFGKLSYRVGIKRAHLISLS